MKILITAQPRTGKTTLVQKLLATFEQEKVSGCITEEILDTDQQRIGFKAIALPTHQEYIIAHTTDVVSDVFVSRYAVDISAVDALAQKIFTDTNSDILIIDEIGRMEALSMFFMEKVTELFASPTDRFILATIVYDDEPFARPFKSNPEHLLLELSVDNRDEMPKIIESLYSNRTYYAHLNQKQRHYFTTQLQKYIRENNMLMAGKFAKRALWYVGDNKVTRLDDNTYLVHGEHGDHPVGQNTCTCDLFIGNGKYSGNAQTDCSHIQAVRMFDLA